MDSTRTRAGRPAWYVEVGLLAGGYLAFGLARAAVSRGGRAATDNALLVQYLEQTLQLAVEHPLNQAMLAHPAAVQLTGYFYRLCLVAVPGVLVWLYLRRPARYLLLRTVLVIMTLLDLPLVLLFPESPPRFAQDGVVDYIARDDILYGAALGHAGPGVNLFAAMPSMHMAWTTWSAYAVWSVLRAHRPRVAWLSWLLPAGTAFVVLATGHHYVLDIVAAWALLASAAGLTHWTAGHRRRWGR